MKETYFHVHVPDFRGFRVLLSEVRAIKEALGMQLAIIFID